MGDRDNLPELPKGWVWTTVGEVGCIASGQTPKEISELSKKGGIPFYKVSDMNKHENRRFMVKSEIYLEETELIKLRINLHPAGTVIFPKRGGSIATNKKRILKQTSAYDLNIMGVYPFIPFNYFYYWLLKIDLATLSDGSNVPQINHKDIEPLFFPLPPLPEQHRIVAKIEELFTQLDAGVELLKKLKAKLKRYRQAVLKAAVEGKLTKDWREAHQGELEPASVLLECILKERREKWEAEQLAQMKAKGKTPKDDSWKLKYKEPVAPNISDLPELPEGWLWARISQLGDVQLGRQRAPRHHTGTHMRPYLRVANVFEDRIDTLDILEMNFTPEEFKIYQLAYGDILLNEGQSLEMVGRPAIYRNEVPGACFQNTLVRFIAFKGLIPEYALCVFRAYLHNGRFQRIARWTTNIAHLGGGRFAELEFPLPSLSEQHTIVTEVERCLSIIKELEKVLENNLKRAEKLRQSILKKAFGGKLVPQDPTDEPADKLLERIKAEKAKREAEAKAKKKQKQPGKSQQLELF